MDGRKLTIPVTKDESVSAILTMPPNKKKSFSVGVITAHALANDIGEWSPGCLYRWLGQSWLSCITNSISLTKKRVWRRRIAKRNWGIHGRQFIGIFRRTMMLIVNHIIAAGKSMGGRVASQMAAEKKTASGRFDISGLSTSSGRWSIKNQEMPTYIRLKCRCSFSPIQEIICAIWQNCKLFWKKLSAPWKLENHRRCDHSFHIPKIYGHHRIRHL